MGSETETETEEMETGTETENQASWMGENLDEGSETEDKAGAWAEQEREMDTEELAGPNLEANLAEREVNYLAGQSPANSYGIGGEWGWLRRWGETGNRAEICGHFTEQEGRTGKAAGGGGQPVTRRGRNGEEIRGSEGGDGDRGATGGREGLGRTKSENQGGWRPKRDNPWDTQDKKG
jgi:hypothetical protein